MSITYQKYLYFIQSTHANRIVSRYTEPGGVPLIALFVNTISGQNDVQLEKQNT